MWRNATARAELLRCNLFLYVEGPGAAGGGSGQVVWSAMHPRTVTTGAPPAIDQKARHCGLPWSASSRSPLRLISAFEPRQLVRCQVFAYHVLHASLVSNVSMILQDTLCDVVVK